MEDNISQRIALLIKELDHTKNSFSNAIGLSNNVTIGRIINENRKPSFEVLQKILLTFNNVNANWLLTGKGEIFLSNTKNSFVSEPALEYSNERHFTNSEIKTLKLLVKIISEASEQPSSIKQ